jgi:hypothetical protein
MRALRLLQRLEELDRLRPADARVVLAVGEGDEADLLLRVLPTSTMRLIDCAAPLSDKKNGMSSARQISCILRDACHEASVTTE